MKAKEIGIIGENIATEFLLKKGFQIIERNFLKPFGEIDIIAKDNNYLVFIEVKTRKNSNYGFPREFVNNNKIKKLQCVAQVYMSENNLYDDFRFDVIEIILDSNTLTHIENAF